MKTLLKDYFVLAGAYKYLSQIPHDLQPVTAKSLIKNIGNNILNLNNRKLDDPLFLIRDSGRIMLICGDKGYYLRKVTQEEYYESLYCEYLATLIIRVKLKRPETSNKF